MAKERKPNGNQYLKRLDHVVWKVMESRGILLNLENGAYFEIGPVGLSIWHQCDGRRSSQAIVQSVAQEFRADVQRVRRDFTAFVAELRRRELVKASATPVAASARPLKKTR